MSPTTHQSTADPSCGVCTDFRLLRKKVAQSPSSIPSTPSQTKATSLPCPPDSQELGRSTWTFLHTMAAYYPSEPTPEDKILMHQFLQGLGRFYPCSYCASHLRKDLSIFPPSVENNQALSLYFCQLHNRVNNRLGKPEFDCSRVLERWKNGRDDCRDPFSEP
jgi:FAD-linked sulfhydryl oxidase